MKTQRIWIQVLEILHQSQQEEEHRKTWRRQDFALHLVSFFFERSVTTHLLWTSSLPTPSFIYCNIFSHLFVSSFVISLFSHLFIILCCWLVSPSLSFFEAPGFFSADLKEKSFLSASKSLIRKGNEKSFDYYSFFSISLSHRRIQWFSSSRYLVSWEEAILSWRPTSFCNNMFSTVSRARKTCLRFL